MFRWIPYAFVRIALFLCAGIALGIGFPEALDLTFAWALLLALTALYGVLFGMFLRTGKLIFNPGWIGLPVVFLVGFVNLVAQTASRHPGHLCNVRDSIRYYTAVIARYTEEKAHSWRVEANVDELYAGEHWMKRHGRIVLYFSKDEFKVPFRYGDVLLIAGSPQVVLPPPNPGEFDYKRFLASRNIYHQHFLRAGDARLIDHRPPSRVMALALRARSWADSTLHKYVRGAREQAIASALVLGVTDGLDNELLNAYAATGAMHVLAVSGLHISIIYMILLWLFRPLQNVRRGAWVLAAVSLMVLWGYAFVTGLSPSVLRAVTMFSFVAVARPARQGTNIYNTLAASVVCLLLFDPFLILSVGFQLSYLAVLGIVYLQQGIYHVWEAPTWLADQAWKITCVSIAAQIATLALGLFYFHQFPNYFLLSNLLAIPGSFVVLIAGIVVLVVSSIHLVAGAVGSLLTFSIKALNFVVFTVEALPFSLIEDIYITPLQCWILMALIVSVILLVQQKRFYYLAAVFVFIVAFTFLQWMHFREDVNTRKLVVYSIRGHSAIDLIDCGHAYFLSDSGLRNDAVQMRFHIRPNRIISGVRAVGIDPPALTRKVMGGKLLAWKGITLIHITTKGFRLPSSMHADGIVIGNNAFSDIGLLKNFRGRIILDSSNSLAFASRVLEQAREHHLDVYSVPHQGAFEIQLSDFHT